MLGSQRREEGQHQSRRRFARVRVDLPIVFSIVGENAWRDASITDLSAGGIRLHATTDLTQGSEVMVGLSLPNARAKVLTGGRVVMSFFNGPTGQYSHGVAFTRIALADQELIASYVDDTLLLNGFVTAPD